MDSKSSQQKYEIPRNPDHNKDHWSFPSRKRMWPRSQLYHINTLPQYRVSLIGSGPNGDEDIVAEIKGRRFCPSLITTHTWEEFNFAGYRIKITEATDSYGAVVWPSALVLCYFLETNAKLCNLVDKNVIELGAGTGLVSIVASLLGARVVSTDLPEVLGNLQHNLLRNTKLKCKHEPKVKALVWGMDLQKNFPRSSSQFDYILAADVVYNHPYLEELLLTFDHLCMDNTTIIWAMRFRLESENWFVDQFKKMFQLEMISDFPSLNITLFRAKKRPKQLQ